MFSFSSRFATGTVGSHLLKDTCKPENRGTSSGPLEMTAVHGLFQVAISQEAPLPLPVSLIFPSCFNSARTFLIS